MVGVATRCLSLTGLPAGSMSIALRPEPPMSMHMVMGLDFRDEALRAVEVGFAVFVLISRNCTEERGTGNRD